MTYRQKLCEKTRCHALKLGEVINANSVSCRSGIPSPVPSQNLENKGTGKILPRKILVLKELDIKILHPKDLRDKKSVIASPTSSSYILN